MSTHRESILEAMQVLLGTLAGVVVYRSREAALARTEGPAILLRPEEETVENQAARLTVRDLIVSVTVIARGPVADRIADPILQALHTVLAADQTLGGRVARLIEEGTKWDFEVADQNAVAVEVRYRLRYLTPVTSLATLA